MEAVVDGGGGGREGTEEGGRRSTAGVERKRRRKVRRKEESVTTLADKPTHTKPFPLPLPLPSPFPQVVTVYSRFTCHRQRYKDNWSLGYAVVAGRSEIDASKYFEEDKHFEQICFGRCFGLVF